MSEEIEQLIRSQAGPIVVQLSEPFFEAEHRMEWIVAEMKLWRPDAKVLRMDLSLHREWARKYEVHGSPCTLVFRKGQLCIRVRGRCNRARLRSILENAGLLDPAAGAPDK